MTIKEFTNTAIEGGWTQHNSIWWRQDNGEIVLNLFTQADLALVLLDPKAWEAVGKVKGWENIEMSMYDITQENDRWGYKATMKPQWMWYMQRMVQELCAGKTLEEYIATL